MKYLVSHTKRWPPNGYNFRRYTSLMICYAPSMRGLATTLSLLLIIFLSAGVEAQDLRLTIQQEGDQTFTLSCLDVGVLNGHTFIEFSTNRLWFPAFFTSSNSTDALVYPITNTGRIRLFRATQGQTIANQVKASWQRLGVTNYVFHYSQQCFCSPTFMVSATVTVMSDEVVKVENARDGQGNPIANPSLSISPTINELFDAWISSEPDGGYAQGLEFDTNGFPKIIFIDPVPRLADEELIFTIDSFTPLP
jgi:hypothetical protein